jgi:hypothetical protein
MYGQHFKKNVIIQMWIPHKKKIFHFWISFFKACPYTGFCTISWCNLDDILKIACLTGLIRTSFPIKFHIDNKLTIMVASLEGMLHCIKHFEVQDIYIQTLQYLKGKIFKLPNGVLVGMWVDNNYIVAGNVNDRDYLMCKMERKFHFKTLGRILFSLGIHFTWEENGLTMKQTAYIEKIVTKFKMEECKPLSIPMQKGMKPNTKMSTVDDNNSKHLHDTCRIRVGNIGCLSKTSSDMSDS